MPNVPTDGGSCGSPPNCSGGLLSAPCRGSCGPRRRDSDPASLNNLQMARSEQSTCPASWCISAVGQHYEGIEVLQLLLIKLANLLARYHGGEYTSLRRCGDAGQSRDGRRRWLSRDCGCRLRRPFLRGVLELRLRLDQKDDLLQPEL